MLWKLVVFFKEISQDTRKIIAQQHKTYLIDNIMRLDIAQRTGLALINVNYPKIFDRINHKLILLNLNTLTLKKSQ